MHSAQRDGIATRTGHLRPEDALDEIVRFFEARVSALRRSGGRCRPAHPRSGDGIFLEPRTGNIAARAVEPSKAEVGVGASAIGLGVAEILLGRHRWPSCKADLGPASLAAELHAIGNGADYVRTHAPGDLRSAITISETLAKFRSRDARDRGLDHA